MAAVDSGNWTLAPAGSTGNNTHNSFTVSDCDAVAFQFVVEAAGSTPTVTFKVQGAFEDGGTTDANATWFDIAYIPGNTNTSANTTQTVTTVGSTLFFLDVQSGARFFRRFRLVTSANTNITYHATAWTKE